MPKERCFFQALKIDQLSLAVHLGCTAEERATPQEVRVSVELRFHEAPKGTLTDALADTICYARVSQAITTHCESREFNLVERMAFEVYGLVREISGPSVDVVIALHKVRPPVANLQGGTWFRCGDFAL